MPQLPDRFAGSISEGTLNPKHLIPRFVAILEQADPGHALVTEWRQVEGACRVLADYLRYDGAIDVADTLNLFESESVQWTLEGLFDALNEVAPAGTTFGASEGDGASFGFWRDLTCPECGVEGGNPSCWRCTPTPGDDPLAYCATCSHPWSDHDPYSVGCSEDEGQCAQCKADMS